MIDNLFKPLPKSYCSYFYYLSVIGFLLLVLSIVGKLSILLFSKTVLSLSFYMNSLIVFFTYLMFYFQNRLLYSMCTN